MYAFRYVFRMYALKSIRNSSYEYSRTGAFESKYFMKFIIIYIHSSLVWFYTIHIHTIQCCCCFGFFTVFLVVVLLGYTVLAVHRVQTHTHIVSKPYIHPCDVCVICWATLWAARRLLTDFHRANKLDYLIFSSVHFWRRCL